MSVKMYPIHDGPSVPYEVMKPHESQCQSNHYQSIDRIAERGGFSCSEAWAVINGISYNEAIYASGGEEQAKLKWIEYAERINLNYTELDQLRVRNVELEVALERLVKFASELCEDVKVSTHQPSITHARTVLSENTKEEK